jgi:hypothetical protein
MRARPISNASRYKYGKVLKNKKYDDLNDDMGRLLNLVWYYLLEQDDSVLREKKLLIDKLKSNGVDEELANFLCSGIS